MQAEVVDAEAQPAETTLLRPAVLFVVVGCLAAAVHWSVVVALVETRHWHPLLANVAGWLVAFGVSFAGHHRWTFRRHGAPLLPAGARFLAVSAAGFTVNEGAYALLLHSSGWRYEVVLAAVLLAVAGATFALSRHWVFRRSRAR